jgi:ATP-binding cassette subfamily B protein
VNLLLIKELVDKITLQANQPEFSFQPILFLIIGMGIILLFINIMNIVSQYVATAQQQRVTDFMSSIIQKKSVEIDLQFYEDPKYHDTLHRAQNQGIYKPVQILNSLISIIQNGLSLTAIAGLFIWLHWSIAVILILSALPALFIKVYFAKKLYNWEKKITQKERESIYLNIMLTVDKFVKEVRIFDVSKSFMQRYSTLRGEIYTEKMAIVGKQSKAEIVAKTLEVVATISIYTFVAYRAVLGKITAGGFVMYFQAFQKGQSSLKATLQSLATLYQNRLFLQYLFEFLDIKHKVKEAKDPMPLPRIEEKISFHDVNFQYPSSTHQILKNINLEFNKGEVIAIVGENGSGKTTLIKLLCRLYDVSDGTIRFDGKDIKAISLSDVRQKISVIFQDYAEYFLSVKENIQISDMHKPLDMERIEQSARNTGADGFIKDMPLEYENMLGLRFMRGNQLSGGQWQKIALARAFYKEADIIVLDEPTSAIDPLAEYEIFEKLKDFAKDKILVLITHRLYNLKMVDQIIVMDKGEVIEQGSHEELAQKRGKYYEMFKKQM